MADDMPSPQEEAVLLEVRDAVLNVAAGKNMHLLMIGIHMALARIVTEVADGCEARTLLVLREYHDLMMDAVPVYCADVQRRGATEQ